MTETLPKELQPVTFEATPERVNAYAALTDDFNPIHVDAAFAATTPFGRPIAHGTMSLNLMLVAAERALPPGWRVGDLAIRFVKPVPVGTAVTVGGTLTEAGGHTYAIHVERDGGERALEGTLTVTPAA